MDKDMKVGMEVSFDELEDVVGGYQPPYKKVSSTSEINGIYCERCKAQVSYHRTVTGRLICNNCEGEIRKVTPIL